MKIRNLINKYIPTLHIAHICTFAYLFFAVPLFAGPTGQSSEAYQFYMKGMLYDTQGNLPAALEEIQRAIQLSPESAYLQHAAADVCFRLGKLGEAETYIERALELDATNVKSYVLAGQIYWTKGDTAMAEERLKRAVDLAPDEAEPLMNLAMAVTPKDPERAIKLYQRFLERHPGEVEVRERVAQLYQGIGNMTAATKEWENVLEWDPSSLRAHLSLAQIAEVEFDTATALAHYDAVLTQDPTNLALLLRVGELRYRSDNIAEAQAAFAKAQEVAPDSASASFWLALLSEHRGDWEEAIALLEPVSTKVFDPGVMLRLSYYYAQAGKQKKSVEILEKLVASEPGNADFLNYLTLAYERNKQYAKAEKILERRLALDPNDHESYFHLAMIYDKMNKFPKAEAMLKKAIQLKPDYHMALNYLGYTYADRNIHLEEAEGLVNTALSLSPSNAAYLDSMGWVYYRLGKLKKAEDFLRQASLMVSDPLIWEHLGDVQKAQGNLVAALLSWDESLRVDPDQKSLKKKSDGVLKKISLRDRVGLFVKRSVSNYADIQALKATLQIRICDEGRPCFTSAARLAFEEAKELQIEIQGALGSQGALFVKKDGEAIKAQHVHSVYQRSQLTLADVFDKVYEVLSAHGFRSLDLADLQATVERKGTLLVAKSSDVSISFDDATGRVVEMVWYEKNQTKTLRLKAYTGSRVIVPSSWEWGNTVQFKLEAPIFSYSQPLLDEDDHTSSVR